MIKKLISASKILPEGRKLAREGLKLELIHFYKGVGVSVGVHGGEVSAADNAYDQTALLAVVQQRNQDTTAVLRVLAFIDLHTSTRLHTSGFPQLEAGDTAGVCCLYELTGFNKRTNSKY